jgi:hypothetical protein
VIREGTVCVLALFAVGASALAGGYENYEDKPFGVRLPPAFVRFREVTTMGAETVANRYSSAINPASAGWTPVPSEFGIVPAIYYSQVKFANDMRLHVGGESVRIDLKDWGTFQPSLSQIRVTQKTNRQGLDFDYAVNTVDLQWAKRCGDAAFGLSFNYAKAKVNHGVGHMRVSESHADSYRLRFGGLWQPCEKLLTGAIFEYGFAPYESKQFVFMPVPMTLSDDGVPHQYIFRTGASYEYGDMSSIYCDYQLGIYTDGGDDLKSNRFNFGVDHRLLEFLWTRLGLSIDVRGNVGLTTGLSAHLAEWISFDAAYQYDMYPELRREFGRSHTLQLALSLRF